MRNPDPCRVALAHLDAAARELAAARRVVERDQPAGNSEEVVATAFLAARTTRRDGSQVPARALYEAFCGYSRQVGAEALSEVRFARAMRRIFGPSTPATVEGRNRNVYRGLHLLAPERG